MVDSLLINVTQSLQVSIVSRTNILSFWGFFLLAINCCLKPHRNLQRDKSDIKQQRQDRQDLKALWFLTVQTSHDESGPESESRKIVFHFVFSVTFCY